MTDLSAQPLLLSETELAQNDPFILPYHGFIFTGAAPQ